MTRLRRLGAAVIGAAAAFGGISVAVAPAALANEVSPAPPGCTTVTQPNRGSIASFLQGGITGENSNVYGWCDNTGTGETAKLACTADTAPTAATPEVPGVPGVPGTCTTSGQ